MGWFVAVFEFFCTVRTLCCQDLSKHLSIFKFEISKFEFLVECLRVGIAEEFFVQQLDAIADLVF